LNLKCDFLVSRFAFKFNLYRYNEDEEEEEDCYEEEEEEEDCCYDELLESETQVEIIEVRRDGWVLNEMSQTLFGRGGWSDGVVVGLYKSNAIDP
jgi:hypothetical protein